MDDDIPNRRKNKIHVPNYQPAAGHKWYSMLTCDEKPHMKTEENYLQYKYLPTSEKGFPSKVLISGFTRNSPKGSQMMVSLSESLGFSGIRWPSRFRPLTNPQGSDPTDPMASFNFLKPGLLPDSPSNMLKTCSCTCRRRTKGPRVSCCLGHWTRRCWSCSVLFSTQFNRHVSYLLFLNYPPVNHHHTSHLGASENRDTPTKHIGIPHRKSPTFHSTIW